MNLRRFRPRFSGTAVALVLVFGAALVTGTTAQAQRRDDRGRDRVSEQRRTERVDRDWHRDRDRGRDWDRDRDRLRGRDWDHNRGRVVVVPRPYVYSRPYPYYGSYGSYGRVGGSSFEEQRGFSDGLNRGQEDSRSGRSYNPNNSSHFRSGDAAYRNGFVRGYAQGYRQFGYRR
ncbi:MAG: hypothetical protein DMF61_17965 [Blastocatellia bacterium AA13]|nr:MAG: hypothetical protein DMF61_17965 [Blastocatellia bacterium AA13]